MNNLKLYNSLNKLARRSIEAWATRAGTKGLAIHTMKKTIAKTALISSLFVCHGPSLAQDKSPASNKRPHRFAQLLHKFKLPVQKLPTIESVYKTVSWQWNNLTFTRVSYDQLGRPTDYDWLMEKSYYGVELPILSGNAGSMTVSYAHYYYEQAPHLTMGWRYRFGKQ